MSHEGFAATLDTGNELLVFYRVAVSHLGDSTSTLRVVESPDYGGMWENDREIYDDGGQADIYPHGSALMDDGRYGVLTTPYSEGDPALFIYSDSGGSAWNTVELPQNVTNEKTWAMGVQNYPSSVGGDDDAGLMVYLQRRNLGGVRAVSTTDNGDSWTGEGVVVDSVSGAELMEPVVSRIGSNDQWVMIERDNNGGNAHISKSTDMINWSTMVDSGQALGANPLKLIYNDGDFHFFACSRKYRNREIEDYGNKILIQVKNAEDIWNDLSAWNDWEVWHNPPQNPLGYKTHEVVNGDYLILSGEELIGDNDSGRPVIYSK